MDILDFSAEVLIGLRRAFAKEPVGVMDIPQHAAVGGAYPVECLRKFPGIRENAVCIHQRGDIFLFGIIAEIFVSIDE